MIDRLPRWVVPLAGGSAAVFAVLALLVARQATTRIDLAVTRLFQSVASDGLDLIANAHTIFGQLVVTLGVAAVLALVAWRRWGGYAWLGPTLILATGAVELLFKTALAHPSPPSEFVRAVHNILGIKGPASSFPSGHVARLAFLALVALGLFPGRLAAAAAVAAILGSIYLRVYIGDHWITDAVAGAMLGAGAAAVAVGWMRATARR